SSSQVTPWSPARERQVGREAQGQAQAGSARRAAPLPSMTEQHRCCSGGCSGGSKSRQGKPPLWATGTSFDDGEVDGPQRLAALAQRALTRPSSSRLELFARAAPATHDIHSYRCAPSTASSTPCRA